MRKGSITKDAALAVSLGDVECHELHSIASSYPQEIISGELEKEIQARLLKAISEDHAARQQTFSMALVKARAAARIVQTQMQRTVDGPAFTAETFDMLTLASTIGPPQRIPSHLRGSTKPHDP